MDNENEILIKFQLSPIALKLRTLRQQKHFSVEILSKITDIPQEDILAYEMDKKKPSNEVLNKLLLHLR